MSPLATLMLYLLAGTSLGLLALLSGIPAAPLAGALLGAGIVSMSGQLDQAVWPTGTRTVLEIGIGTVIGTGLTRSLTRTIAGPLETGIADHSHPCTDGHRDWPVEQSLAWDRSGCGPTRGCTGRD